MISAMSMTGPVPSSLKYLVCGGRDAPDEEAEVRGHVEVGGVVGQAVVDQGVRQPVEGDQQEVAPGRRVEPHHLDDPAERAGYWFPILLLMKSQPIHIWEIPPNLPCFGG